MPKKKPNQNLKTIQDVKSQKSQKYAKPDQYEIKNKTQFKSAVKENYLTSKQYENLPVYLLDTIMKNNKKYGRKYKQ